MSDKGSNKSSMLQGLVVLFGISTVGLLVTTIILATRDTDDGETESCPKTVADATVNYLDSKAESNFFSNADANKCKGAKIELENEDCIHVPGPQAGGNVTKGYVGGLEVDYEPYVTDYIRSRMCPVNVHWHLGTEHYSLGEYDEYGDGPNGTAVRPDWADRRLAEAYDDEYVRGGFRCHHYDADDEKFTKEYDWQHCINMEVGETYEVHWPHSSAGACGTVNQYQTPFYDGVFCNLDLETLLTFDNQTIANNVGVQGQIFTIVNDEKYFYPDLMRGMIVDESRDIGKDIAIYTGSTTGTTRSNKKCSQYAPITWQVDRKCVMISASSFDRLCLEMKMQRDNMEDDLHAHGSRELVKTEYVANNQQSRHRHLWADGEGKLHKDILYVDDHDHDHHHHDHDEWF